MGVQLFVGLCILVQLFCCFRVSLALSAELTGFPSHIKISFMSLLRNENVDALLKVRCEYPLFNPVLQRIICIRNS